ncbi:hypothetical protein [Limnochorda pilosa]|uniref:Uncharacterized protein n=1 Tax=Limnochorda pilosa TaxID=1555112 RepID=A0A0K2SH15_LIMPI|nr:hypothetical protein [Limnochorda pilosa]BAS26380.1 hypothetical protein LIP_0523 [Limnochorda pilosa]
MGPTDCSAASPEGRRPSRGARLLLVTAVVLACTRALAATAQGFTLHGEVSYGVTWSLDPPKQPQTEYRLTLLGAGPLADWVWASVQLDTDAPDLVPFAVAVATWGGAELVTGDFDVQLPGAEMVSLRRQLRGARLVLEPGETPYSERGLKGGESSLVEAGSASMDGSSPAESGPERPGSPAAPSPVRPSLMVWSSTVRSLAWQERFEVVDPAEADADDDLHTVGPTDRLVLELSPVLEGSETVRKNSRLLEAPLDYQLDAASGVLYFDPPLEEGDVVDVSYQVAPLSPEPLEGARIGVDLPGLSFDLYGLDGLGYADRESPGALVPPLFGFVTRLEPGPLRLRLERWVADDPGRLTLALPPRLPELDDSNDLEAGPLDSNPVGSGVESESGICTGWTGPPEAWAWELGFDAGGFEASRGYRLRTPGFPLLDDPEAEANWAEETTGVTWRLGSDVTLSWRSTTAWPCWSDPARRKVERLLRRQASYRPGPGQAITFYTLDQANEDELFGGGTFRRAVGLDLVAPVAGLSARARVEGATVLDTDLNQETKVRHVEASLARPLGAVAGSVRLQWEGEEGRPPGATAQTPPRFEETWEADARPTWQVTPALQLRGRWAEGLDKGVRRTEQAVGGTWQAPEGPWRLSADVNQRETSGTVAQVERRLIAAAGYEGGEFRTEVAGELPLNGGSLPVFRLSAASGRSSRHRVEGRARWRGDGAGQLSVQYAYQPEGPSAPRFRGGATVVPRFFQVQQERAHVDLEYFVTSAWSLAAAWDATSGASPGSSLDLQVRYRF